MLQTLDHHWRDHLAALDHLRQGIHLRGYAQKNPKQEYKREAFELFSDMLDRIKQDVVKVVLTVHRAHRAGRAGGRGSRRPSPTSSTSTPATTRRWRPRPTAAMSRCAAAAVHARRREGRPQRPVPVRLGQEIQALPRARSRAIGLDHGTADESRRRRFRSVDARPLHAAHRRIAVARAGRHAGRDRGNDQELEPRRRPARPLRCAARSRPACSRRTASAPRRSPCAASTSRGSMPPAATSARSSSMPATPTRAPASAGLADARAECVAVARLLDCAPEEVLPFSTGVIMEPLPIDKIIAGLARGARRRARRRLVRRGAARS